MTTQLSLKEIERKAFRSTYEDGLQDLHYGLVVICMSFFIYRPATGYSPMNLVLMSGALAVLFALFWAGKKFITLPRMGQVTFGPIRKQKKSTLAIILGAVVAVQVGIVALSVGGWLDPELASKINAFLKVGNLERLAVSAVGALFVGPSMILIAYFSDFPRGYYIAILMSLAVFLMVWLNRPLYPIILGALIALPGLVLFVNFLRKYPLPDKEALHE